MGRTRRIKKHGRKQSVRPLPRPPSFHPSFPAGGPLPLPRPRLLRPPNRPPARLTLPRSPRTRRNLPLCLCCSSRPPSPLPQDRKRRGGRKRNKKAGTRQRTGMFPPALLPSLPPSLPPSFPIVSSSLSPSKGQSYISTSHHYPHPPFPPSLPPSLRNPAGPFQSRNLSGATSHSLLPSPPSLPPSPPSLPQKPGGASPVKKFVGSNFLRRVAEEGKDVLVLVTR